MTRTGSPVRWRRVVLVTGSTSGIGEGIARRFATGGDRVIIHGRSTERGLSLRDELSATAPDADVRLFLGDLERPEVAAELVAFAVRDGDPIDVLVNNAGTNVFTGILGTTLADWEHAIALDLRAAWLCSREAAAYMPRGSAIINIGSNHARATLPGAFPYNVAKAGMVALTQSLALELAPLGIRANLIEPGWVDTPLARAAFDATDDPYAERERVRRLHAVDRIGTTVDVAEAAWFLASSETAGYIDGATLVLDGGRGSALEDPR